MIDTLLLNSRKTGKIIQLDYDFISSIPDRSCLYCLTDAEVQVILGLLDYVGWRTRWYSESGTIDQQFISDLQGDIGVRLMRGCCGDETPIQWRYTTDGVLQRSEDGGNTWQDAPEYDPRNYSPQYPPIAGDDGDEKKCIAATGAVLLIKEQIGDNLTDDMTRYTLGQLISDWVKTLIGTSNPFIALMTVISNQIFALVIAVLRPALTDSVYDTLQCILYCDMADDASFNEAQWEQVRSDILDQISGIAGIFLEHLIYLIGKVGLTNLVRSGAATEGDCSTCDCPVPCGTNWHVRPDITAYTEITEVGDNYITVSAHGIIGSNYYGIVESGTIDSCCTFDHFEIVSGSIELWAWMECNTESVTTGLPTGHCMHQLGPQSSVPFVVKLYFTDCA